MSGPLRRYSELAQIKSFKERFDYLRMAGVIGDPTFGFDRYLNQLLYTSSRWRETRRRIIVRDNGCDLACPGYNITSKIIIHHINPITMKDVEDVSENLFDPENLICVSHKTHNAIHFGDESLLVQEPIERRPNDTCPWK